MATKRGVPVHVLYEDICGIPQLFAASFPLAPLIALIIILIDIRVDSRRMLWMYRRPVAAIAQDIGRWLSTGEDGGGGGGVVVVEGGGHLNHIWVKNKNMQLWFYVHVYIYAVVSNII